MSATTITTSSNIASLNSKIISDLCAGIFYVDITNSIFIGSGASNVLGASVKIVNPYGVTIKDYPTSGYDIYPPMTEVVDVNVPTQAGNYQYGQYTVSVQLTDSDGTVYTVTKTISICAPDQNNKTRNYGSLSALLNGNCKDGKVYIIADTVPTYQGAISNSQVNAFTLEYPTSSGLSPIVDTPIGSFSTTLFEGIYKFNGTICASYDMGDSVSVKVNYKVKREKNIRCLLDENCIAAALSELNARITSDCTDAEKKTTQDTIVNALYLIKTIEVVANAGQDASDFIDQLETVLGCVCTCNCAEGTPIINTAPAKDFSITGCNVEKTTVGLTDTYVIDNFAYVVAVTDNGGVITISAPILADCTQTQTITFNIAPLYTQIKNQITGSTEFSYWASIINKSWDSLDVSCLGYTSDQWSFLSYSQRSQIVFNKICAGADCDSDISTNTTSSTASDVIATWTNVVDVYEVFAYLDGIFAGSVLAPIASFRFVGAADGTLHTYKLIAKCSNGSIGETLQGTFTYYGCPSIAVPTVTSNNVTGATCPYDLTALVNVLPMGIGAEWHNLNNTDNSSLVATPSMVTGGIYYVFAKDSNGCYSTGVQVILTCSTSTACSAPQTLVVEAITGGFRARFQSAAFPPPSNSYTVKRRLSSDPDISGSYTTIGTPTWNASVNRWEILDATAANNTLYTYRAVSNCTSSAPYIDYQYANLVCPSVTLTPHDTTIDYSFTNSGGSIDKYEVKIYDVTGTTLIHTDTIVPAFSSPITGTFIYLTEGVSYKVMVKVFIGAYYSECPMTAVTTTYNYTLTGGYNFSIDSVTGTGVPALAPTGVTGSQHGHQTGISGNLSITVSGTLAIPVWIVVRKNAVLSSATSVSSAGTYVVAVSSIVGDNVLIVINSSAS